MFALKHFFNDTVQLAKEKSLKQLLLCNVLQVITWIVFNQFLVLDGCLYI